MEFQTTGAPKASHKTDAFVLFRNEGARDLRKLPLPDAALAAAATAAVKAGEFKGRAGEMLLLHGGAGGRRLLVAGLGPRADATAETLRAAAGSAAGELERRACKRATFLVPDGDGAAAAIAVGAGLGLYRFDRFQKGAPKRTLKKLVVAPESGAAGQVRATVEEAAGLVNAVAFARDLGNLPGNIATPVYLARQARELAGGPLTVRIHDRAAIKKLKMGAFLGVAQGSTNEPRLIEFRYRGAAAGAKTTALVGKGVTFDTGGISIKPTSPMWDMKFDMCGGAAVFGAMHALAALRPKINVIAFVPATDNMPDGSAYRPGDILTARNGKTIEIQSTDAEGRLLLCDALAYAVEKKPDCVIDLATLTGACAVALGDAASGLFSNNDKLRRRVEAASERTGEIAWPLPLFPRYTELMKGDYADLRNSGVRYGGASTAAAFLQEFVGKTPWVHLDIAGVAWTDKNNGYRTKGATGYGVRLLWEFLTARR